MKKIYSVLIVLLLVLTACAPKHTVAVNVLMEDDFSGVLEIKMSMKAEDLVIESPSEGEKQASLEEVQTVITTILSETNRFNKDLVKSEIKDDVLNFTYEESFDSLEGFEAIVSKVLDETYTVKTYSYGSLLSGKTEISGVYFNTDSLLSWIYDEIETRKSFGDNSTRARTYLSDESKLLVDGKEIQRWSTIEVLNNPQLESVYYDIYLNDDSSFDSTVTVTAKESEMSVDEATLIVSQFEKEAKNTRLSADQSFELNVVEDAGLVSIELETKGITGSKYTDLVYELIDADVNVSYSTNDDNSKASLSVSLYNKFSNVAENTDEMDLRVHLNNYEIKTVNDVDYNKKSHADFDIEEGVISNIENATDFMLALKKPLNLILIVGSILAGLLVIVLAFFGIKKVSASNKAKKDSAVTEVTPDVVDGSSEDKDETISQTEIIEEVDILVEDSTNETVVVKELKITESSVELKPDSLEAETLNISEPVEAVSHKKISKQNFVGLLSASFKDGNTYVKAAIFVALTLVLGLLALLLSASVIEDATEVSSLSPFLGQVMMGFGLASGAGIKMVLDSGFSSESAVFNIPFLLALIVAYCGTLVISSKILHSEKTEGEHAFAENIAMSAIVLVVLLVFSIIPIPVMSSLTISLNPLGVILRALPMHIIMAFVCAYKLNFNAWPLPLDKEMLAYIAQRMFFIMGLSTIALLYILIKAGIGAIPFAFNIFAITGFLSLGGSVALSSSFFDINMGPILTFEFSFWLLLLMILGLGIMVFNVDDLIKKTKEKDPIKFSLIFAGIVVLIYAILASLSSITINMGSGSFLEAISFGVSYVSVLIAFALLAALTYIRVTVLAGVDLKAKVGEASKTLVDSAKNASASIASGSKDETSRPQTEETTEISSEETIVESDSDEAVVAEDQVSEDSVVDEAQVVDVEQVIEDSAEAEETMIVETDADASEDEVH